MLITILITFQIISISNGDSALAASDHHLTEQKQIAVSDTCPEIESDTITIENWEKTLRKIQQAENRDRCFDAETTVDLAEKVVEYEGKKYYYLAEQLYYKALDVESKNPKSELILREARKVLPLLSDREREHWENKIEAGDPSLARDLKMFWKLRDPVVSTPLNERLTEHWVRIAHARNEFTKDDNTVFGTDDRGTIYIKYGEPSYKRDGMLSFSNTEVRSMLYDLSFHKGGISPREMFNLNMAIKQQYMPRYYEVWVYKNLDTRRPTLFIFGESAERGTFGLRESVEEFISGNAYRMGITSSWRFNTGARGLSAGPFLQMGLYNQLSTIDIYFGRQLAEYDQNWLKYLNGHVDFSSLKMMNSRERAERELRRLQEEAPGTQSTLAGNLDFVKQNYRIFRFLNNQNEPVTKVFIYSEPDMELIGKHTKIYRHQNPRYHVKQSAVLLDPSSNSLFTDQKETAIEQGSPEVSHTGALLEVPSSVFSDLDTMHKLILSSEINRRPDQADAPVTIIASSIDIPSDIGALNTNSGSLQISDLIWGFKDTVKNHSIEELDFFIPSENRIPKGKNFAMYFEAYNLGGSPDALFNFQMEYSIHRVKRRKLIDTGISLTLNFGSTEPTSKETLEVETSDLEEGKYLITCNFKLPDGEESVERTVEFEIVD